MTRPIPTALGRLAVLGMLALALAGCGKKGALDAPPSAAIEQPGETPQKQANHPANQAQPKQHFILDWLID